MATRNSDSESLFIPPYNYIHVLHQNSNVTKLVVGPHTFIRQDNERVVLGPDQMITVPPRHYCIIKNHTDQVIRLAQDPFPVYPGEVQKKLEDATHIHIEMFDMDTSDTQSAPIAPKAVVPTGYSDDAKLPIYVASILKSEVFSQLEDFLNDSSLLPEMFDMDTSDTQSAPIAPKAVVPSGYSDDAKLPIDVVSILESEDFSQVSDMQKAPVTQPCVTEKPVFPGNSFDWQPKAEAPKQYEGSVPKSMEYVDTHVNCNGRSNNAYNPSLNGLGMKFRRVTAHTEDIAEAAKLLTELPSISKSIQPVLKKALEPSIPGTSTTSSSSSRPFFMKSYKYPSYTNPYANTSADDNSVPAPNTQQLQINSVEWQTKAEAPKQYESSVPKSMEYVDTHVDCDGRSNKASSDDLGIKFRRTQLKTAPQRKKCEPVPEPSDSGDSSDSDDSSKPKVDQKQSSQSSTSSKQNPVQKKRKLQGNKAPAVGRRRKRRRGSGRLSNNDLEPGVEICESADCKRPKKKRNSWVQCDDCDGWYHTVCVGANYNKLKDSNADFFCGCMPK